MRYDVTALGEALIDFTPVGVNDAGVPLYAQNPGGAPLNCMAQNSKLGGKTAIIGKVGADGFGDFMIGVMQANGIDTHAVCRDEKIHTTLAFVQYKEGGERTFSFYRNPGADIMLTKDEIDTELINNSHIFHIGSLSTTSEPIRSATYAALECAKEAGCIVSYDPNYRAPLWDSEERAIKEMKALVPYADIIKVSDEELPLLTGTTDPETGSKIIADMGPTLVLVSLGGDGAFFRCGDKTGKIEGFKVDTIDTNGAGDAFFGSIHYKLKNSSLDDIKKMTIEELKALVTFGCAAGALTTTAKGSIPAMRGLEDIEALANS